MPGIGRARRVSFSIVRTVIQVRTSLGTVAATTNIASVDIYINVGLVKSAVHVRTWIRTIAADTPPATVPAEREAERPVCPGNTDAPSCPGVVVHMESPRRISWVVIRPIPRSVVPTRAVNDSAVIVVTAVVAWRVANVNDLGSDIIDFDVGNIVVRI